MPYLPTDPKYHIPYDELVLSKPEAAKFFGYTLSNFRRICKDNELDKGEKKGYVNVHKVFLWWKEQNAQIGQLQTDMTITEVKKALEYEKLLKIRIENQELAGNLIPKDKVKNAWRKRYIDLKTSLTYLIGRLTALLSDAEIEDYEVIIEKELKGIMDNFNKKGRFTPTQK